MYIALAVFICSPSAYEALKSFNILQLTSRATLQAFTEAFMHEAGAASESISKQVEVQDFSNSHVKQKRSSSQNPLVYLFLMK